MLSSHLLHGPLALLMHFTIAVLLAEGGNSVNVSLVNNSDASDSDLGGAHASDPSYTWHDYSTVQIWMGKAKVQVGTFIDFPMEQKIRDLLDRECPASQWTIMPGVCHHSPDAQWPSTCMNSKGQPEPCTVVISEINAEWDNANIRKYMIKAVASALQGATIQDVGGNCWDMGGDMAGQKACNVGDVVRVNFPPRPAGESNFFHIRLKNWYTGYGTYECCSGHIRQKMDIISDALKDRILKEWPDHANDVMYRDSRCIINEWATCPNEEIAGI